MASDFFGDVFDAITGQQATPQNTIVNTNDALNQAYATAQGQIPNFTAYNQALQPVMTGLQLSNQNQIFGPAANQLQQGSYQSILDSLNLGASIPQELQNELTTNYLQGSSASGLGATNAARMFAADQGRSFGLNLQRQRQQDALGAALKLPTSQYQYQPEGGAGIDVGGIFADQANVRAQIDEFANMTEDIRRQNFSSLLNTGGRILGTAIGGAFGGAMGAQMGGQIGGSVITGSRVGGQQRQQQQDQGSGFASILSGLGGMGGGGGAYGGGSGMYTAPSGDRPYAVTAGRV